MPRRLRTALLLILVVLPATLTACTGTGHLMPSNPPSSAGAPLSDINPQPRTTLADGGELRLPIDTLNHTWNPLAGRPSSEVALVMSSTLPRLFNDDPNGNPSPNPDYLAAVSASGGNPQVVTYTLSSNAAWNSGRQIDADDFIADWQACNGSTPGFNCNATKGYSQVASVKAGTTSKQVIVTYKGAYDNWPQTFDFLLPKESVTDPATFTKGWSNLNRVNGWLAGPFVITSADSRAGVLIETPNPDWWGNKPKLSQLTFRVIKAQDRFGALRHDQLDAYDLGSDTGKAAAINALNNCEVRKAVDPNGKASWYAARETLANYGAFGRQSVIWTNVGYLQPTI